MERIYKNSSYLFATVLLVAFLGFYKSYFSLMPSFNNISSLLHFHTIVVILWFAVMITQPILIRQNKLTAHHVIGKISYGVAALFVISVVLLQRVIILRNSPHSSSGPEVRLAGDADLAYFILFYILAICYRKRVAFHARFMVITVLPFINPSLGRLGFPGPIIAFVILIGLLIYEAFNNKVYRPFVIGLISYVAIYWFFLFGIDFEDWRSFWLHLIN